MWEGGLMRSTLGDPDKQRYGITGPNEKLLNRRAVFIRRYTSCGTTSWSSNYVLR